MIVEAPRTDHDGSRLRVLIADDEPTIVSALEKFLTRRGHEVMTAKDAASAIDLAEAHIFDAAILDVRMPGGGGLSVIARLRDNPRFRGHVVLMTGALSSDPDVRVDPGVVRMQKPFRLTQIIEVLEGVRG